MLFFLSSVASRRYSMLANTSKNISNKKHFEIWCPLSSLFKYIYVNLNLPWITCTKLPTEEKHLQPLNCSLLIRCLVSLCLFAALHFTTAPPFPVPVPRAPRSTSFAIYHFHICFGEECTRKQWPCVGLRLSGSIPTAVAFSPDPVAS